MRELKEKGLEPDVRYQLSGFQLVDGLILTVDQDSELNSRKKWLPLLLVRWRLRVASLTKSSGRSSVAPTSGKSPGGPSSLRKPLERSLLLGEGPIRIGRSRSRKTEPLRFCEVGSCLCSSVLCVEQVELTTWGVSERLSPEEYLSRRSGGVTILYISYDPAGNPLTTARLSDSLGHGFWRVFSGAAADEDEASASESSAWGSVMPNLHPCLIFFMKILHSAHGLAQFRFTDSGLLPTASAATTSGNKRAVPLCRQSSPG